MFPSITVCSPMTRFLPFVLGCLLQPADVDIFLTKNANAAMSSDLYPVAIPPPSGGETSAQEFPREFPLGFEPLRSEQLSEMRVHSSEVVKDPFCSPLLAPDNMLKGLPPVHIVVSHNREIMSRAKRNITDILLFYIRVWRSLK